MAVYSGLGYKTEVSYGKQAALGTAVPTTYRVAVQTFEPAEDPQVVEDTGAYGTLGPRAPLAITAERVTIESSYRATPQSLCHALRRLCGPPVTTQPDAGGNPTVYDHYWEFMQASAFAQRWWGYPYTVEYYLDLAATSRQYVDATSTALTLRVSGSDRPLTVSESLTARGLSTLITKTAPAITAIQPWIWHQLGFTIGGGASIELTDFQIVFTPGLEFQDLSDGTKKWGECLPNPGDDGANISAVVSGNFRPVDYTEYAAYLAHTPRDFGFVLTGDTISTTYKHTITVAIDSVDYRSLRLPRTAGRIVAPFEARAVYNAAMGALCSVTIRTNVATAELA